MKPQLLTEVVSPWEAIIYGEEDGIEYAICPTAWNAYKCVFRKDEILWETMMTVGQIGFTMESNSNVPEAMMFKDMALKMFKEELNETTAI